jgi:hypothetical protein
MDSRAAATRTSDPDALEFVRFCYRRRRVGWPELYDEMCAVAGRGLYRGYSADDLADHGIRFGLFDMPALASIAQRVVEEERAKRRPMMVVIEDAADAGQQPDPSAAATGAPPAAGLETADVEAHVLSIRPAVPPPATEVPQRAEPAVRFATLPARA